MLGARDRMGRHEMHSVRQMRAHVPHDRALHRADVGHDRAGFEMRRDLLGHSAANPDGHADDDEIGPFDRLAVGLDDLVGNAQLGDTLARLRRTRRMVTIVRTAPCARAARAIEEPIKPGPMMAMVSNSGSVMQRP